jgi:hypothetical protein
MKDEDWGMIHTLLYWMPPEAGGTGDVIGKETLGEPEAFKAWVNQLLVAIPKACEACAEINKRGRKQGHDLPMQGAVTLWRLHSPGGEIGTNEEGPFARFARLFFRAIDPEWEHRTDSLQRRIRQARQTEMTFKLGDGRKIGARRQKGVKKGAAIRLPMQTARRTRGAGANPGDECCAR